MLRPTWSKDTLQAGNGTVKQLHALILVNTSMVRGTAASAGKEPAGFSPWPTPQRDASVDVHVLREIRDLAPLKYPAGAFVCSLDGRFSSLSILASLSASSRVRPPSYSMMAARSSNS